MTIRSECKFDAFLEKEMSLMKKEGSVYLAPIHKICYEILTFKVYKGIPQLPSMG